MPRWLVLLLLLPLVPGCENSEDILGDTGIMPQPEIHGLRPAWATVRDTPMVVEVEGAHFNPASFVVISNLRMPTEFVDSRTLRARVSTEFLPRPVRDVETTLFVITPYRVAGETLYSAEVPFLLTPGLPAPVITAVEPAEIGTGSADTQVEVRGEWFTGTCVARIGDVDLPSTLVDPDRLVATLPASLFARPLYLDLMIRETAVGGGVSDPFRLEVLPPRPVPVLEGIDPERMEVADPSTEYLSIEAIGSGFDRVSVVEFGGVPLETSFLSETRLRARLPSEFILDGGSFPITVVTRAPGGGTTNRAVLTVENPAPVIETLSPHFHRVQSGQHVITIDGEGFVPGTRVALDGQECVTRWIDPSRLEVVPPRFETLASTVLELSNTTPGGGRDSTRVEVIDTWTLPYVVHDAVYDAPRSRLLVTGLTQVPADRLAAIDPFAGTILSSVYVGTDPRVLALSNDADMLYIGLDGLGAGRQYEVRTDRPGLVFEFGNAETGKLRADDMYVLPGHNESLVVALKGFGGNYRNAAVFVFDDGVRRPDGSSPVSGTNRIARIDDRTLVAFRNTLDDDSLWRMTIDAGGVTAETLQRDLFSGISTDIWAADGRVYHTKGAVVDATSLTLVATLPVWGSVLAEDGSGEVICVSNPATYPLSPAGVFVYELEEFGQVGFLDTGVRAGGVRKVLRIGPATIAIVHADLIEVVQSKLFK